MNFQRQGWCPIVELAAECELSPRGEGANKTQHNTNKPPGQCEPASQPASRLGWQQSPLRKPARTMKSFMSWTGNRAAEHPIRTVTLVLSDHVAVIYLFLMLENVLYWVSLLFDIHLLINTSICWWRPPDVTEHIGINRVSGLFVLLRSPRSRMNLQAQQHSFKPTCDWFLWNNLLIS